MIQRRFDPKALWSNGRRQGKEICWDFTEIFEIQKSRHQFPVSFVKRIR